jgi:hypothetical protein
MRVDRSFALGDRMAAVKTIRPPEQRHAARQLIASRACASVSYDRGPLSEWRSSLVQ